MFHKQFNSLQYRRWGDLKSQGYKEKTKRVHFQVELCTLQKRKKMNQRSAINSKTYAFLIKSLEENFGKKVFHFQNQFQGCRWEKNLSDIKLLSHPPSFIQEVSFSSLQYFLYSYFFQIKQHVEMCLMGQNLNLPTLNILMQWWMEVNIALYK